MVPEIKVSPLANIAEAKRMLAHGYMSSKMDVSQILADFPDSSLDSWVMKAAQKAYAKAVDGEQKVTVQRVDYDSEAVHAYHNVHEMRVGHLVAENAAQPGVHADDALI